MTTSLRVEEDGDMHTLDPHLEGTPAPQAETIPVGVNQVKAPHAWPTSQGEGLKVFICHTGIDRIILMSSTTFVRARAS
jgi:hypothetical protein